MGLGYVIVTVTFKENKDSIRVFLYSFCLLCYYYRARGRPNEVPMNPA